MTEQLKKAIKQEFAAPKPEEKHEFIQRIRPREISLPDLLLQQVKYIRNITWAGLLLLIPLAISGAYWGIEYIDNIVSAILPFTVVFLILEVNRSYICNMSELEAVTRFSLKSIVFARMVILGTVSLLILISISPLLAIATGESILMAALKTMIPYQMVMVICLHIERSPFGRKNAYASLAVAAVFSALILWMDQASMYAQLYYTQIIENTGPVLVLLLMVLTVIEQRKLLYNLEAIV